MRIKKPCPHCKFIIVEAYDHQDRKAALECRVGHKVHHGFNILITWLDVEAWVAMPFADVVEAFVLMFRAIKELQRVPPGFDKVDNKTRE